MTDIRGDMLTRYRTHLKSKEQGFTLIEILIVVVIIGILVAISVPIYLNQQREAMIVAMKTDVLQTAQMVGTAAAGVPDEHTRINMSRSHWKSKVSTSNQTSHVSIYAYKKTSGYLVAGSYYYCVAGITNTGEGTVVSYNTIDKKMVNNGCVAKAGYVLDGQVTGLS